jgi:predicted Zn finger-like uncharacterized protein
MSIQATCPNCQTAYNLPDALAGKKVRCKKCEQPFVAVAEVADGATNGPESKRLKKQVSGIRSPAVVSAALASAPKKKPAEPAARPIPPAPSSAQMNKPPEPAALAVAPAPSSAQMDKPAEPAAPPVPPAPSSTQLNKPAEPATPPAPPAPSSAEMKKPAESPALAAVVDDDEPIMARAVKEEPAELEVLQVTDLLDKLQDEARPVRVVAAAAPPGDARPLRVTAVPPGRGDADEVEPVPLAAPKPPRSPVLTIALIGGGIAVVLGLLVVVGLGSFFLFRSMKSGSAQGGGSGFFGGGGGTNTASPQNVDEALARLQDNDPGTRREGANWLEKAVRDEGRRGEVNGALEPLLSDGDPQVRNAAVKAMKTWGPSKDNVPALMKVLNDANMETRQVAIQVLGDLKDAQAAEALAARLPDFFDRSHASKALRDIGPSAEKAVLPYFFHTDGGVQAEARSLLKGYGTKQSALLDAALAELKSPNANMRRSAAEWFAKANPNTERRGEVAGALEGFLTDQDWGARNAGLDALAIWATKENVPGLLEVVKDDQAAHDARHKAMRILGKLKDGRAAGPLCQRLSNFGDRDEASKALQELGPAAEKEVAKYVFDKDAGIRAKAQLLLKGYGTKDDFLVDKAVDLLKGNETERRKLAAEWLGQQNSDDKHRKEVAEALDKLTTDINKETRVAGLKALKVWATADNIPALVGVLKDDDIFNRDARIAAMQVLASLKDEQASAAIVLRVANIHDRAEAVKALIATGPAAEKMVMQGVATTTDDAVATELIKVLGEIGTKNCVPLLTRATKSKNPFLARAALLALKHVSERAGDAGK